jgi:vesicle coat complex subunit
MIWIIGEYAERIDNADELLESFLETFPEEPAMVQLQLLTATVKLFLKKPTDVPQQMIQVICLFLRSFFLFFSISIIAQVSLYVLVEVYELFFFHFFHIKRREMKDNCIAIHVLLVAVVKMICDPLKDQVVT